MPLDDVFDYFRSYDKSAFAVYTCQGNEPTERDVTAFEQVIGFRLPEDFRTFVLSPLGGLYMEVHQELWPRPEAYDVGPFWSFLYGLKVFGISSDIPEWLDIRKQFEGFRAECSTVLVPFLQLVGVADRFCFDPAGRIVAWDHDAPDDCPVLDTDFPGLLMREIRDLQDRKDRKLAGERN